MKTIVISMYLLMPLCLYACKKSTLPDYETKVRVLIKDDDGKPIPNINVRVTHDYMAQTKDNGKQGITDNNGFTQTSAKSLATIWIRTRSEDYYPTFEDEVANVSSPLDYTNSPLKELNHSVTVRKIINPIPLHAKINDIPIPENRKWIGFDLEKADWVKPWGKGEVADIELILASAPTQIDRDTEEERKKLYNRIISEHNANARQKNAYPQSRDEFYELNKGTSTYEESLIFRLYNWQGTITMRVPFDKGGIIAEKDRYLIYSKHPLTDYAHDPVTEMRMPHQAPTSGYVADYKWNKKSGQQYTIDEKLGFFIKTRVKLDEQGNEISAHYAKIIQDPEIDIRGRIKFTTYFNPSPNDTNLEFDLKKNLIKNLKELEMPYLP